MSTSLEAYKAAAATADSARKQAQALVKDAFAEEAKKLLDELDIDSFSWTQYTPYFNDGDVCVFGAHTDYDSIRINNADSYDYEAAGAGSAFIAASPEDEEFLVEFKKNPPDWRRADPDEQRRIDRSYDIRKRRLGKFHAVSDFLGQFDEDDLLFMFGDHVEVTVDRTGVTIREYDHD